MQGKFQPLLHLSQFHISRAQLPVLLFLAHTPRPVDQQQFQEQERDKPDLYRGLQHGPYRHQQDHMVHVPVTQVTIVIRIPKFYTQRRALLLQKPWQAAVKAFAKDLEGRG